MIKLNIHDETSQLKAVLLGTAESIGPIPKPEDAYDPKSLSHIIAGTYPKEADMVKEMEAFASIFDKYDVQVFRPKILKECNQVFSRDIAFVIEDKLIKANILPDREKEFEAIDYILAELPSQNIIYPPEEVHVEGGDVMPWNEYIFIGTYTAEDYPDYITARTNKATITYLSELFPHKTVKSFELRKSNTNARENALHLDCCFQPLGKDNAIVHKNSFLVAEQYQWLFKLFWSRKCF